MQQSPSSSLQHRGCTHTHTNRDGLDISSDSPVLGSKVRLQSYGALSAEHHDMRAATGVHGSFPRPGESRYSTTSTLPDWVSGAEVCDACGYRNKGESVRAALLLDAGATLRGLSQGTAGADSRSRQTEPTAGANSRSQQQSSATSQCVEQTPLPPWTAHRSGGKLLPGMGGV